MNKNNTMQEVHDYIEEQVNEGHITPDTALKLQEKISNLVYCTKNKVSDITEAKKVLDKELKKVFKTYAD